MTAPTLPRRPLGGGRRRPPLLASAPDRSVRPARPPRRANWAPLRGQPAPRLRGRLIALLVVLAFGFAAVLVRLVDVQGISASRYAVFGQSQRVHTVALPAQRGSIVDRNGAELAVSVKRSTIFADPQLVTDPAGGAKALAPVLGMDEGVLRARLTATGSFVYLARRVDDETARKVEELKVQGVARYDEATRVGPAGPVAGSVVGVVGSEDEGLAGLEKEYEKDLAGKTGERVVERDPAGRDIAGGVRQLTPPVRGKDLVLTLDRDLQYFTEQALADQVVSAKAKSGIAIVMDPRTGEILAMANVVAGEKGKPPVAADYNKAVIDVYEPGSVNKVVTISAAIEDGAIGPSDRFSVPDHISVAGTVFWDSESHPTRTWTAQDVMAQSSNAGAILIAQDLGEPALDRYLRAFGLDDGTGLGFPGEAGGIVPALDDWSGTTLPTLAIGYGLAVTPLHMLEAYNTIANGGVYVAPSLVRGVRGADGKTRRGAEPATHRVVSAGTARTVTDMLSEVVRSGTGTTAAVPGYTVAGKTGTARKVDASGAAYKDGAYVASFAGFLPAEAPRLSAIVVLDEPQPYYGGLASGPVFSQLAAYAVRHYQVPPGPSAAGTGEAASTLRASSATRP